MKKMLLLTALLATQLTGAQIIYFPPLTGTQWETASPGSLGWNTAAIPALYQYLEENNTKAFIVLRDGRIVLEQYFGTFVRDSLWYWASAGKTLTAFTVGMAQEEGYLSIDDRSADYLGMGWTACPPEKEALITVRHQLTMTTGLDDKVPDHYCTLDTCLQYKADAGTRWAYHNGPYTLLDGVIENATGQSLNAYFLARVRNRIGMNGLFIRVGYNNVYFSNARSMARFGLLMQNGGAWNGNAIMTDTAYFRQMINTSNPLNLSYGYLWWLNGKTSFMMPQLQFVFPGSILPHAPADLYAALGKNGQILNVAPSLGLVVVRMGDAPDFGEVPTILNDGIWERLQAVLGPATGTTDPPVPEQLVVYPNPARTVVSFSGLTPGQQLQVTDLQGRVRLSLMANAPQEIIPLEGWPGGLYIIRCGSLVRKLVLDR